MTHTRIAAALALVLAVTLSGGHLSAQSGYDLFQKALAAERADGNLQQAIQLYGRVVKDFPRDRALAARALVRMAECYEKLGDQQSRAVYERLLRDYADQKEAVAEARTRLEAIRSPAITQKTQAARQIWAGIGVDGGGSPSPDGRYLTFTDWDTGDLAVRDFTAGTSRRLTKTGGWAASGDYADRSLISPDGRQVAYAWFIEREFKNELRIASLTADDSTRPRVVMRTDRNDYLTLVAWAPNGKQLFVVRWLPDRSNQIGAVSVEDGSFRSIKSLEWRFPSRVSLSPNGQYLAYDVPAADSGSPRDIFVLASDGSRETAVVQHPANDEDPIWSADGSRLLFISDRTGNRSLWMLQVEDGRPIGSPALVKTDVGAMHPLGMTKGGVLYYYITGASRRNLYTATLDAMRATSRPTLATETFVNTNFGPAWSRDGEYLAYFSLRNAPVLVIRSTKTGAERTLPLPAAVAYPFNAGPKWFPDNRSVLILVRDAQGTGFGFYRLTLEKGDTELLWRFNNGSEGGPSSFDLSPDGKTIFWAWQHPMHGKLMRFDIDSRRETELKKDEWFIAVAASPDGTELSYLKSIRPTIGAPAASTARPTEFSSVVEVMPVAGGQSREVFGAPHWLGGARYNTLGWTPDQRFLLFVQDDGEMWRVPARGGQAEKVGISVAARIKSPAVHPDGTRIVFATIEGDNNEVWTLENFLPPLSARQ